MRRQAEDRSEAIELKSPADIEVMRRGGRILHDVLDLLAEHARPGVTTLELDRIARAEIERHGSVPAFLGLYGFPGTLCISVNEEIVHGIPGPRVLQDGDIVSLDCGLVKDGFYLDSARTVPVGRVDAASLRLIQVTEESLEIGIEFCRPGVRLGDLSAAIQRHIEKAGMGVVREYTGHGIGRRLHEEPKIPNYGTAGKGVRFQAGMVLCVEPMVNLGTHQTRTLGDKWTVVTADGSRSAHVEHTIAITPEGPLVLT
jgi:methionyl aminopeptidase